MASARPSSLVLLQDFVDFSAKHSKRSKRGRLCGHGAVQPNSWVFWSPSPRLNLFCLFCLCPGKDAERCVCVCVCVCINLSWPSVRLVLCLALTNVGYVVGKKRSTSLLAKKRNQQDDRLLTAAVLRASCSRPLLCGVHIPILVEWTCCKHMANDNRTNGPNGESDTNENEMQGVESRLLS